ncbi:MAG: class II glutamine amidotransferase [Pseudomonadota bacterium]
MCELFAMSSDGPATVKYSLEEFARHGGLTRENSDGWGITYYEGAEVRLIKEAAPAASSPWVDFIAHQNLASNTVIAHVRMASRGHPTLENTHPFERELGGRRHVFAHNGTMHEIESALPLAGRRYRPIGETDSEHAFCLLLERLQDIWANGDEVPAWQKRFEIVTRFAWDLQPLGQANFLYSDGDVLFVHAQKRRYQLPDGSLTEARPPGLNLLIKQHTGPDHGVSAKGLDVSVDGKQAMLFASVPLTNDLWVPLPEGAVLAIKDGHELGRNLPGG